MRSGGAFVNLPKRRGAGRQVMGKGRYVGGLGLRYRGQIGTK